MIAPVPRVSTRTTTNSEEFKKSRKNKKGLFRKGRHRHSTDGSVTAVATVARHVVVCDPPRHRLRRAKYSAVPGGVDVAGRAVV